MDQDSVRRVLNMGKNEKIRWISPLDLQTHKAAGEKGSYTGIDHAMGKHSWTELFALDNVKKLWDYSASDHRPIGFKTPVGNAVLKTDRKMRAEHRAKIKFDQCSLAETLNAIQRTKAYDEETVKVRNILAK